MTHYRIKAEGYGSVASSPGAQPQNQIADDEWQQAQANLGAQPAALSQAEWTLRLFAEVRRLRAARGGKQ